MKAIVTEVIIVRKEVIKSEFTYKKRNRWNAACYIRTSAESKNCKTVLERVESAK